MLFQQHHQHPTEPHLQMAINPNTNKGKKWYKLTSWSRYEINSWITLIHICKSITFIRSTHTTLDAYGMQGLPTYSLNASGTSQNTCKKNSLGGYLDDGLPHYG